MDRNFISEKVLLVVDSLRASTAIIRRGYQKHQGDARQICRQVVETCWNGTYFKASEGPRLAQFWIRDFAWSLEGLLDLGQTEKVKRNLSWAMAKYATSRKVASRITPGGIALDVFYQSADSLPMLLYALRRTEAFDLIAQYRDLLNAEIARYYREVFDPKTLLVRADRFFTEPKDTLKRRQTCVATSFMIFLADLLAETPELTNPFERLDLRRPFTEAFWTGAYFRNDLENDGDFISSDANLWPYWTKVVTDREMLKLSIDAIRQEKLDVPFPLKYQARFKHSWAQLLSRIFIPNYQGTSIWTLHAPIFIELVSEVYPHLARAYLKQYLQLIERYGTYVEVFEPDGSRPLKGRFGFGSEMGMPWAAMIPRLIDQLVPRGNLSLVEST